MPCRCIVSGQHHNLATMWTRGSVPGFAFRLNPWARRRAFAPRNDGQRLSLARGHLGCRFVHLLLPLPDMAPLGFCRIPEPSLHRGARADTTAKNRIDEQCTKRTLALCRGGTLNRTSIAGPGPASKNQAQLLTLIGMQRARDYQSIADVQQLSLRCVSFKEGSSE